MEAMAGKEQEDKRMPNGSQWEVIALSSQLAVSTDRLAINDKNNKFINFRLPLPHPACAACSTYRVLTRTSIAAIAISNEGARMHIVPLTS